jgi:hypothetical protein
MLINKQLIYKPNNMLLLVRLLYNHKCSVYHLNLMQFSQIVEVKVVTFSLNK